jgi:hypothetical protein
MGNKIGRKCEQEDEVRRHAVVFLTEREHALVDEFTAANRLPADSEAASRLLSIALGVIDECAKKREIATGTRYPTFS